MPDKTALIIAYYFPPLGMGGVQRMAKLARYLPDFGYNVKVLTVKPVRYPAYDRTLLDELPAEVSIIRSGSSDPARIGKFIPLPERAGKRMKTLATEKSKRFWPDSKIGWRRPAVKAAEKLISEEKIDIILSSSPPITGHLVAMDLKEKYDLPWAADFRDPWESRSPDQLYDDKSLIEKSRRLLEDIVTGADKVITINDTISRQLSPDAVTIMGGYDPEDFKFDPKPAIDRKFTMCYLGTVGPLHPLEPFFEAAAIASKNDENFEKSFGFTIIGANDAHEIKKQAAGHGLEDKLELISYLPHCQALREASSAAAFLISAPAGYPGILTGKIFDYLPLSPPILASVPGDGEIRKVIDKCRAGLCAKPNEIHKLADNMLSLYRRHRNGEAWEKRDISVYSRREMARGFAEIFDSLEHE